MTSLSPLLIPAALGYSVLALLLRNTPLRGKNLFLMAASIPTGFGICSLILFFSIWIIPSKAMPISLTSGIGLTLFLGGFLLWKNSTEISRAKTPTPSPGVELFRQKLFDAVPKNKRTVLKSVFLAISCLIFLITLWNVIHFFLLSVSANITGGWDARYMWSLKAKFLFRSPEAWQGMFSPVISWSHGDYPLLWPGTLAWGWNWLGHESFLWPPWASLCFYISSVLILVWYLRTQVSPLAGWWGGTFFLLLIPPLFWSISLYTDLPLAFFMTASTLMLLVALRAGQAKLFMVSGLMAGLAAWTKNEGMQFLAVLSVLLGGLTFLKRQRTSSQTRLGLLSFLGGICLPLITVMILKIFFGKSGEYLGSGRSIGEICRTIFSQRSDISLILRSFAIHGRNFASWKGLWCFFSFAGIVWFFKKNRNGFSGIIPVLILLLNSGYALAFLISPANLSWHLATAFQRLLVHTAPLALVFSFEMLTFRTRAPEKQGGQTA